ncbi:MULTISPECIES: hypothetical protein [Aeromonas]|nr:MULTISPECIES: hypothetical protein [unclassified Aeromonas]
MYFRNLLKLFSKNKNASEEVHPEVAESVNLASSERGSQEQNGLPTQVNSTSERESKQVQHCTEEAGNPISLEEEHHHRTQALADKVYAESGASFYSEIFPDRVTIPRSSRLNSRMVISPSVISEFYELCRANINHLKPGDILRVKENGVFNHLNGLVCDLANLGSQVVYRDKLKVEEVFAATYAAPAYVKVERIGYEYVLIDYIEVNRSHIKTHDGQHILSIARDYAEKTPRSKENFCYKLQLVENLNEFKVVLFFGQIETAANEIDFGDSGQGTDGCTVLGTLPKGCLSETALSHMEAIADEYDRPHTYLRYLRTLKLELIVEEGQIYLCIFDTTLMKNNRADVSIYPVNNTDKCNYIRIENGKYRCSQSGEMFVSSWYFEKRHGVKLNDVEALKAAQADGIQHDKKCRIEFESARRIWGEYVYMYPERWLEQQSSRLW